LHALKLVIAALAVGLFAVGCSGGEEGQGASQPASTKAPDVKPKGDNAGGAATANAKNMTPGPGANKDIFGSKGAATGGN